MLSFEGVSFVGLNCPYFTGVQEHGTKVQLDLDKESADKLEAYGVRNTIHVFSDNTILLTEMHYNYALEEHEEFVIKDLTNDEEIRKEIDNYINENNIYRFTSFPYRMSFEREPFEKISVCLKSLKDIVAYCEDNKR